MTMLFSALVLAASEMNAAQHAGPSAGRARKRDNPDYKEELDVLLRHIIDIGREEIRHETDE